MRLVFFRASGWRNLCRVRLHPAEHLNLIWGNNAQGKTNLLEAIYFLSTLRSFRTTRPSDLVGWDAPQASLGATVRYGGISAQLGVSLQGRQKFLEVDGKKVSRSQDYFIGFCAVLFTPEHLSLVRGDPSQRREFLDRTLFGLDPNHLALVRRYNTVLRQRNRTLKDYADRPSAARKLLAALDVQLAQAGARLAARRADVVQRLAPVAADLYGNVAGDAGEVPLLQLRYKLHDYDGSLESYERFLIQALDENHGKDLARGHTQIGPHRDELLIQLRGHSASRTASAGEARSVVLCLKLAELLLLNAHHGEPPVLLLDDLGSELDARRRTVLFRAIEQIGAQTFISSVQRDVLGRVSLGRVFAVSGGIVQAEQESGEPDLIESADIGQKSRDVE